MPRVIVPVGFSLGPQHRYVRPADPEPEFYEVHLGGDMIELDLDEFTVYGSAFLDVAGHAKLRVTRDHLVRSLLTAPTPQPDAERLVTSLVDRGLLLEFDPEGPLQELFSRYRLFPTAEGMGTTAEEPEFHRMGRMGTPLVAVHNTAYVMWAFSFLHSDLWKASTYLAAGDTEELELDEEPVGLTPEGVARELALNLPMMISTQCAFLDPVVRL